MKQRRLMVLGAAALAGAMALTACGGDDDSGGGGGDGEDVVRIYNVKPENPLIPANTNEVGGGNLLQNVFRGLVSYNPDTAAPEMAAAESIESTDNTTWTVKLKAGQTFQDGTPVTSDSFIKAWNWGAYGPNGNLNNYFFAPIDGYADLNPADPDEDGPEKAPEPKTDTMSGLVKVSDTEFTVKLSTPQSFFPVEVGYTAFYPLPESFYSDTDAFGVKPIGNGPFKIDSGNPDLGWTISKWDGYKGADAPKVNKVQFKTYTSGDSAYQDLLAGNLDFMDQVPAADLVNDQYQKDFPDRYLNKPVGLIGTASLPSYDKNFTPDLNKALSLAIDRDTITKQVFNGGRTPATGWVSPVVDGYKPGACGEFCTYDKAKALEYFNKQSFKGPFTFSYNSDGPGNKEYSEAICNSIKNALNVECTAKAYTSLNTLRTDINDAKMTSMFKSSWQMDYPSIQNFLEPLYATGASSNDSRFSNPVFDNLIKQANGEEGEKANTLYQQAEATLAENMYVIPLWYYAQQAAWSDRVANVKTTPFSTLDLSTITLK